MGEKKEESAESREEAKEQERLRQQAIKEKEKERTQFYQKQKEGQKDIRAKYREKYKIAESPVPSEEEEEESEEEDDGFGPKKPAVDPDDPIVLSLFTKRNTYAHLRTTGSNLYSELWLVHPEAWDLACLPPLWLKLQHFPDPEKLTGVLSPAAEAFTAIPFAVFSAWVEVISPIASCLNTDFDKADAMKRTNTKKNLILILNFVFSICVPCTLC